MDIKELIDSLLNSPTTYQAISVERIILSLLVTFIMSMLIFYIYRKTYKGVLYSKNFNVGLVLAALVTTMIIIAISSNIALSLGMVGALSIVRFRAAVKDPSDVIFTFWAIAIGITSGAALYIVTIVATPIIGAFIYLLCQMDIHGAEPYLLVVRYSNEVDEKVKNALPKNKLRSRTITDAGIELMVEVRMKKEEFLVVDHLREISGVKDAAIVSYNGDYSS